LTHLAGAFLAACVKGVSLNDGGDLLGWLHAMLIGYDEQAPSLLRKTLQSPFARRQAVFAALALEVVEQNHQAILTSQRDGADSTEFALLLRDGRASDIIPAVYGSLPDGFLGALERVGANPLRPAHYVRLFKIFATGDRQKANALRHIGQITDHSIQIVDELLPVLVDGKIVSRLESRSKARELSQAFAFIRRVCSTATDDAITNAIRTLPPHATVRSILLRHLIRADLFPPQPFAHGQDEEVQPLDTAMAMSKAATRYKNCLRRHLGRVMTGAVAFAEFRQRLILELRPLSTGGWMLTDVHTVGNGLVAPEDEQAAKDKCASLGVPHIVEAVNTQGWDAVARLTGKWDWAMP
jgi:hypothetical protein